MSKKGTRPYLPYLDPEVKNELFDLSNSLNKWRRCISKETAPDKWDCYLDEADHLLTNEEVEDIMTSKPAVDGRAALLAADQADDVKDLSLRNYCDARDFLIVTLTRAVGTRPAPLENATIRMFQNAQWDDNKHRKVMMREEQNAGSFKCKFLSTKSMKSGTKVSEDFEDDDNHSKDQSAVSPSSASSKRSLSAKHHAAIKEAFAEDIVNEVEPRKNHVVAVMKSDLVLRALVNSESLVKKVSDRVRYLVQRRPTMMPEELPEEPASTRIAAFVQTVPDKPPSSIESGRVEWSEDETMAIREVLTLCYDKCPTNDEIRALFKRSSELIAIFKSNTFGRIWNKVKNEFRKLKN